VTEPVGEALLQASGLTDKSSSLRRTVGQRDVPLTVTATDRLCVVVMLADTGVTVTVGVTAVVDVVTETVFDPVAEL
jgi:hypothetical protein